MAELISANGPRLHLDFETRSEANLKKVGSYLYAIHPSTDVLCLAWAVDDEEVELWHPGLPVPDRLFRLIAAGARCEAWNAGFEREVWRAVMVGRYFWPEVREEQWRCVMAKAQTYGLPGALEKAAAALRVAENKDKTGKMLIQRLCKPRKPSKTNPAKWNEDPADLARLYAYCKQDVRTERAVSKEVRDLSDYEQRVWLLDQKINRRGVAVDRALCHAAIEMDAAAKADIGRQLAEETGGAVAKPTDRNGMAAWLKSRGVTLPTKLVLPKSEDEQMRIVETLEAKSLKTLFDYQLPEDVERALQLYIAGNKTSVAKYKAMLVGSEATGRLHDMFAYHAAATGRWGGRRVQLQNLPRPPEDLADMEKLAADILTRDYEWLCWVYGADRILTVLSSALRGAIVASSGRRLIAADFSAVEARGLAWIARDEEMLEVFRALDADPKANWDVYTWQASQILGREITKKDKEERQNFGKVSVLGCGYAMGAKKLVTYAAQMGAVLDFKTASKIVKGWRAARMRVVAFWKEVEDAALEAVRRRHLKDRTVTQDRLRWKVVGRTLVCRLPSGRLLNYLDPKIEKKKIEFEVLDDEGNCVEVKTFWKDTLTCSGTDAYTRKWGRYSTYGGKLTENVVQALCRDLLADAMLRQDAAGYELSLHVHDETVADVAPGFGSLSEAEQLMSVMPVWASGFPLRAEGWHGFRFRK